MPTKPNILFILTDQMRGDCLSITGHPVVQTPTLDTLGRQGAVFTRAYAACPSCIAARACMFTGKTPNSAGRLGYRDKVPWRYDVTLPAELAKGGYQCHVVGKTHFYPQRALLGFHSIESYEARQNHDGDYVNDYAEWLKEQSGGPWDEHANGVDSNSWVAMPSVLPEHLHNNSWTATRAIEFLRRRDHMKPFFLNVSFHRPHAPVDPPPEYFHLYDKAELPPVPVGDWAKENDFPAPDINAYRGRIPAPMLDRLRRAYWGQITHIDQQINRLLVHLTRNRLYDNTIVIFCSDHGELLGDHFLYRKSLAYEGSAKIPFIVAAPPKLGFKRGAMSDLPITHMDLMPTMLDIAGLPLPEGVEGRSLVPALRSEEPGWREYLHGEHTGGDGTQFVVGSRYKFVWFTRSGRELLFDLQDDPEEKRNLADKPQYSRLAAEWRDRLIAELAMRPQDKMTDGKKLTPGVSLPAVRPELLEPYSDNEGRRRPAPE